MTFLATIFERLAARPEADALVEVQGRSLVPTRARDFAELVARARGFLAAAGVRPGDRVGLLAPNSTRWAAADLAILAVGAVCVPLYARQDPRELAGMLRDCAPSLLLVADEKLEAALRAAWPEPCRIARLDAAFGAAPAPAAEPPCALAPDRPVTIIYTSGTSGEPKGVVLTCANVDYMLPRTAAGIGAMTGGRAAGDRVFHYLPFCFAGSRIMLWTQLFRGNPLTMSTDLTKLVEEIGAADPHYMLNVPAVLERIRNGVGQKIRERGGFARALYNAGTEAWQRRRRGRAGLVDALILGVVRGAVFRRIRRSIGPSLEFLVCGSAPLSEETQDWFAMLEIPVYQVYGLTETTAIVAMDRAGAPVAPGRVGYALDGCEVKLSEECELLCRGPNVFPGYWNRPDATAQSIRDGWFHSGDQAEVDKNGNWKIVGRLKNLLKPESGHYVAPEPLEQMLREACPGVEQALVVGHARPFLAAIVTGPAPDTDVQAALDRLNAELPHYRRIRRFHHAEATFSVENGLLTANQKLRRAAIEAQYREAIERLYT